MGRSGWWRDRFRDVMAASFVLTAALIGLPATAETILRARLNSDILSTDPGTLRDENTDAVLLHVVEGLVASREDGSVGPMLASGWTVSEEGKEYRFALRPDVVFHNGAPLTSAEVVWSLNRYLQPATHWRCRAELIDGGIAKILKVEAPDPHSVIVRLDRPAPLFLKTLARADCGGTGIVHPDSLDPSGHWRALIGTGPFQLGEWRRNQFIELTRFSRYAALPGPRDGNGGGKQALVDRVRFLIIPDGSSAVAALLRGSIDVLDGLGPTDLGTVRDKPGIRLDIAPTLDFYALLFQVNDPSLQDVRLRRAIALCIDVAGLTKAASWGTGAANSSPIPAASPFFGSAEAQLLHPDLAEARRLVAESGYRGQPIRLLTNHRYPQLFDAAVLIQAMTAEAGIVLQIETLDWASQLSRYASGSYQSMVFAFSALLDPSLNFARLIGDKSREPRKVWDTPEARRLLQQSIETDGPGRQAVFDALNQRFLEDTPAVVLFNSARISAVRANIVGYRNWAAAQQRLWGVGVEE